MVFEKKIKDIPFISVVNGEKTLTKKFVISRELADEYNKIISVFNAENPKLKLDNSLLFKIIFSDFLESIEDMEEEQAIELLKTQTIHIMEN